MNGQALPTLGYCHSGTEKIHWALVESVSVYHEEVAWRLGGGLFGRQSFDSDLPLNTQVSLDKLTSQGLNFFQGCYLGNVLHRTSDTEVICQLLSSFLSAPHPFPISQKLRRLKVLPVSLCPLRVHVGDFPQVGFGDGTELPLLSLNCCLLTLQLVSGSGGQVPLLRETVFSPQLLMGNFYPLFPKSSFLLLTVFQ